MQCPLCLDSPLEPKFVGRTEVDICPRCRGVWLDRGELDRLLDGPVASTGGIAGGTAPPSASSSTQPDRPDRKKQKKQKSRAKRLADLLDEVLDL